MINRNNVKYQGKKIDLRRDDIRDVGGNRVEFYVEGTLVAFIEYGGNIPKSLHISKIKTIGPHKHGYAKKLMYYVMSKYKKLDLIEVKAFAEKITEEDMDQKQLVKFYEDFTYGPKSKNKILIR